jgi:hypothetical protein
MAFCVGLASCSPAAPPAASVPAAVAAGRYQVVDATGAYLAFLEALPALQPEERVPTFRKQVIAAHPHLFAQKVIGVKEVDAALASLAGVAPP